MFEGVEEADVDEELDAVLVGEFAEFFDDSIGLGFMGPEGVFGDFHQGRGMAEIDGRVAAVLLLQCRVSSDVVGEQLQ